MANINGDTNFTIQIFFSEALSYWANGPNLKYYHYYWDFMDSLYFHTESRNTCFNAILYKYRFAFYTATIKTMHEFKMHFD